MWREEGPQRLVLIPPQAHGSSITREEGDILLVRASQGATEYGTVVRIDGLGPSI